MARIISIKSVHWGIQSLRKGPEGAEEVDTLAALGPLFGLGLAFGSPARPSSSMAYSDMLKTGLDKTFPAIPKPGPDIARRWDPWSGWLGLANLVLNSNRWSNFTCSACRSTHIRLMFEIVFLEDQCVVIHCYCILWYWRCFYVQSPRREPRSIVGGTKLVFFRSIIMAHVMRESRELWAARFLSHLCAAISATPTTRKVHDHDIRKQKTNR